MTVAARLGVHVKQIERWELGSQSASAEHLAGFIAAVGANAAYVQRLLERDEATIADAQRLAVIQLELENWNL
jgi:transcriptional regulator with XRE-family HTH domain